MRHFLFLQGMPCDFFKQVGLALEEKGHTVSRINLSFSDWLFWHDQRAVNYRGQASTWPRFFSAYVQEKQVTDLVLLGEQRKYHKEAVQLAKNLGLRIMATDFGYFRPDWITLEPNGMGGESTMTKNAQEILAKASKLPTPDFATQFHDSSWRMSMRDVVGSLGDVFLRAFFPHYRQSTERPHPFIYFPAMGAALVKRNLQKNALTQKIKNLQGTQRRYFCLPLQLDHDFQIKAYSPYTGMVQAVEEVLASFAHYAPPHCDLWIKSHPWDPGLIAWKATISQASEKLNIAHRVHYLDGGNVDEMMANAQGVVTVNSTAGLKALQLGCPVVTLGSAVYDVPGLTHQQGLDSFWFAPERPEAPLLDAFIKLLVHHTQIRGVFFHPKGKEEAIQQFVNKLLFSQAHVPLA